MAGLVDEFTDKGGNRFKAYTILTIDANQQMARIHDRMPVIVPKGDEDKWLDPQQNDLEMLKKIIVSSPLHLIIE